MGLDAVELIWRVEEAFAVDMPDEVAERIHTVGHLHGFVLDALRTRGEAPDPEQVWARLKAIFVEDHGVPAELVVPAANIVYDLGLD